MECQLNIWAKFELGAHIKRQGTSTDASNHGAISDNFLAKNVSLGDRSKKRGHWA